MFVGVKGIEEKREEKSKSKRREEKEQEQEQKQEKKKKEKKERREKERRGTREKEREKRREEEGKNERKERERARKRKSKREEEKEKRKPPCVYVQKRLRVYGQDVSVCTGNRHACVRHACPLPVQTETSERTHRGGFPRAKLHHTPHKRTTTHATHSLTSVISCGQECFRFNIKL